MNCEKTVMLMTEKLAGEISPENEALLLKHIASCDSCREEFAKLEEIWKLTEETLKSEEFQTSLDFRNYAKVAKTAKRAENIFYRQRNRILEYAACFLFILILAGMMLPALSRVRQNSTKHYPGKEHADIEVQVKQIDMKELEKIPSPPRPPEEVLDEVAVEADKPDVDNNAQSVSTADVNINIELPNLTAIKPNNSALKMPAIYSARKTKASRIASIKKYCNVTPEKQQERKGLREEKDAEGLQMFFTPKPTPMQKAPSCAVADSSDKFKKECDGEEVSRKIFSSKVNLKLWDLTTEDDVRKLLAKHGINSAGADIELSQGGLTITIPEKEYEKLKGIFDKLNSEEEKLRNNKDGLLCIKTEEKPVSTFSIDVDTASYTVARKRLQQGVHPSPDSVRPEEFINYFDYHYPSPRGTTFGVYLQAAPSPVRTSTYILRIGVQGKKLGPGEKTSSSYTILVDTSGSMAAKDRLELVKKSIALFTSQLKPDDRISLILCGDKIRSAAYRCTPSAPALKKALSVITASGPTDLGKGIEAAYKMALDNYMPGANNKVVIFSDGIFEPDNEDREKIIATVEKARTRGVGNIVIALGGDGDDNLMEQIADKGDGSYVFIDSEEEASAIFKEQFAARFREIAKDVKIQVEFNPEFVKSYRQVGYDNRQLSRADFRNDKVDAGEVGSGQSVTAIYEIKLKASPDKIKSPAATVRIRYKNVPSLEVEEREYYLEDKDFVTSFNNAEDNLKLAFAVGEFAEFMKYPDVPGIATPRLIGDLVKVLRFSTYSKDRRVEELYSLINSIK